MGQQGRPGLPDGVSQREIADEIGVSVSTVSRALSGNERVSRRTLDDVQRAIATVSARKHDGHPLPPAGSVTGVIGLTTSHISDVTRATQLDLIVGQVLGGAELAASRLRHRVYTARDSKLLLSEANRDLLASLTGLLLAGGVVSGEVLASARATGLPVCLVGGHVPASGIPSVASDFQHGAYLATKHLLDLGHRRIALVNGPHETYTSHEKLAGYLSAMLEAGVPVSLDLVHWFHWFSAFDSEPGQRTLDALLALAEPPTAIVFATDDLAVGAIALLQRRGRRVPADFSVVGFHDDPIASSTTPLLTTVRVDRQAWGERAVERLVAAEHGEPMQAERLLLPVELIVRDSSGPPPAT